MTHSINLKDPFIKALLVLCIVLSAVILFVLFGGVRFIYSTLGSPMVAKSLAQENYLAARAQHSGWRGTSEGEIMTTAISDSSDLREELFSHLVYSSGTGGISCIQGACTDGTYIWAGWSEPYMLMKLHILTRKAEIKLFDESDWHYGHMNDMTYNPETGKLYISSYGTGSGTSGDIAVVDADTLQYESTIHLTRDGKTVPLHGIAYDRIHRCFITTSSGSRYDFFDQDFQYLKSISTQRFESDVLQGIETDGAYIYRSLFNRGGVNDHIAVYDMEGNFVKLVNVPAFDVTTELEDIMYDWKGNWYINTIDSPDTLGIYTEYSCSYIGMLSAVDYSQMDRLLSMLEGIFSQNRQMAVG